uniref:Uncharacterized protein n=1 Tax=Haptolina ericina TaxID=156174 RepID=A0A7S3B075_9EUKA|mmetsp:Transcript_43853/g.99129  ORF Transcript_43853/g.99129 Transcript_43853/m.99129 type:complete len:109 (+) Transcript_43853:73-399(+)
MLRVFACFPIFYAFRMLPVPIPCRISSFTKAISPSTSAVLTHVLRHGSTHNTLTCERAFPWPHIEYRRLLLQAVNHMHHAAHADMHKRMHMLTSNQVLKLDSAQLALC